jgi:glycosyltransferase involved in cell wall biosynthesis
MARQTVPWHQWVVVDDCLPATKTTLGQQRVEPRPEWQPGQITLGRNLLAGLEAITGDAVICVEDDDWYAPDYLAVTARNLGAASLVGEGFARYYNVRERQYLEIYNAKHASLAATAWLRELTPKIIGIIGDLEEPFYDLTIWRRFDDYALMLTQRFVVGIKGMPGRKGIGIGHVGGACRMPDPNLDKLREWIGPDDADSYASYRR